jgi:hypothetical protein
MGLGTLKIQTIAPSILTVARFRLYMKVGESREEKEEFCN